MGFSARALFAPLVLLGLASPAIAESPFGSPAWVREQEALRQAEDARRGRRPAAPPAASPAPPEPAIAAAPPEPEAPAETALAEPPPEPHLPLPQVAPSPNPLSRMAFKDLDGFRQRPLFAPSRRRPDQPVAYAAPLPLPEMPASPPPELRLVGIVAGVDRAVALVSRQEGASLSLRVGDQVDAWRVDRIAPDRVVLREGEREQTYRLFALPPAAAPGAGLPAGAVVRVP
ncbi:hypothetical protein [Methylorubrum sp. SB2]|uniref:hypothetical protein n=1 Tax=Methylorubrum subtropicum TaxID=3138812 RepID=UPI00313EBA5A